jgi:predicted phage baseplate assembly protein
MRPAGGTAFSATYRVGNGASGNVGPDSLAHVVTDQSGIVGVANPLPAAGGVEPESAEHARQSAPAAFRTQQRAVTLDDYGEVAGRHADVQKAAATLRWTGSWRTVFVSVDRLGGRAVDEPFRQEVLRFLDLYRMAGQDVDTDAPRFVSLELELFICLERDQFASDVEAALRRRLGNRALPDGSRGVFHPDNFSFGQPVYLSPIVAAVQAVPGVDSVEVKRFRRQGVPSSEVSAIGVIELASLEIPRLDQDPDFPEHGRLALEFGGGR